MCDYKLRVREMLHLSLSLSPPLPLPLSLLSLSIWVSLSLCMCTRMCCAHVFRSTALGRCCSTTTPNIHWHVPCWWVENPYNTHKSCETPSFVKSIHTMVLFLTTSLVKEHIQDFALAYSFSGPWSYICHGTKYMHKVSQVWVSFWRIYMFILQKKLELVYPVPLFGAGGTFRCGCHKIYIDWMSWVERGVG